MCSLSFLRLSEINLQSSILLSLWSSKPTNAKHRSSLLKREIFSYRFEVQFWPQPWPWTLWQSPSLSLMLAGRAQWTTQRQPLPAGDIWVETTALHPSEQTASTPVIQGPSEASRFLFFMTWEKHAAALRLFFLAEYWGQCQCTNTSSPKVNSFPWRGEDPLGGHPTPERKPPSEIRLPLPSAGFWSRAALGVQMVTLVVYGFGGGWMNRLGYLLSLVLACNVLLHERLSGSDR